MAPKTVKKTSAKPAAKKVATKKIAAKKPAVKKVAKPVMAAPAVEMHAHECPCGGACKCAKRGSRFGRIMKKLIIAIILFALGFAAAKFCPCNKMDKFGPRGPRGPRVEFVDGCMDVASVKCPKLRDALPAMDINQDGCITRDEYRAVKREMRREIREMNVEEVDTESPSTESEPVVAE